MGKPDEVKKTKKENTFSILKTGFTRFNFGSRSYNKIGKILRKTG
tara:strand:+ start:72837 stop:72971 length:135 start_codon:yes stop_codon:yes gene_type:complete